MLSAMVLSVLEATPKSFPIIPVIASMTGALIVFVLARLAMYLYRSGEVEVTAKRILDLNPRLVKLSLRVENREKNEQSLKGLCLVRKEKKGYFLVSSLEQEPVLREGPGTFVITKEDGFGFVCQPNQTGEIVVEFLLPSSSNKETFLAGYDRKGKFVVAPISLVDSSTQLLSFRRGNYIK